MIITCKKGAPQNEVEKIVKGFEEKGLEVNTIHWNELQRVWNRWRYDSCR